MGLGSSWTSPAAREVTYNGLLGACKDARGQHWGIILQLLGVDIECVFFV